MPTVAINGLGRIGRYTRRRERRGTVMESSGVPIEAVESESPALDEPALAADDIVHECGLGSFPASDPPSWWAAGSNQ
jgi:hypothetical protein